MYYLFCLQSFTKCLTCCQIHNSIYYLCEQKSAYHRSQTLAYNNGFALPRPPTHGIGQDPLKSEELAYNYTNELSSETLALFTEPSSRAPVVEFIPAHVALDKKVPQRTPLLYPFTSAHSLQHADKHVRISTGLVGFLGGSGRHTVGLTVAGAKGYSLKRQTVKG